MSEEKIQELFHYLSSVGLEVSLLEKEIRDHIEIRATEFSPRYEFHKGDEKMEYVPHLIMDHQFQKYRLADYNVSHVDANGNRNNRNFSSTAFGICHADLAYHIVSGRLDALAEKLSPLKLEEFPSINLIEKLERNLPINPEYFEIKCFRNEPEGFIEFTAPISKIEGWYDIDSYKAVLTPYPPIEHGVYNGIDSRVLEDKMRGIDWHNDGQLFYFIVNAEPEFVPEVDAIYQQINCLSLDPTGTSVADKLMLKYWGDATFFENILRQSAWDYLESLPKREQLFPVELEAKAAFNLLCGRAILQKWDYLKPQHEPVWTQLDFTTKGTDGRYLTTVMQMFTEEQLESVVRALPVPDDIFPQIIRELKRGDISYFILHDDKKIFLAANPGQRTVNVYSEDMRPIKVNFHFDPEWEPSQKPELNKLELQRKPRQNIIHAEYPPNYGNRFRRRR
ncbi:MAG: hypothetical protein KF862_04275 [Chitinophagaceae bacterium]|nr:hypothetical protein [Chitinophagaceae bacterium]